MVLFVLSNLLLQVCQVSAQQPVQTELLMRYHQLQSRLATLKIENEEVRAVIVFPFEYIFEVSPSVMLMILNKVSFKLIF